MELRHILRFLFVRGVTTILLVSGFGVEGAHNDHHKIPILLHVISFYGVGLKREDFDQSEEYLVNCNDKLEILFPLFLTS
jgi:hypothetical protein